MPLTFSTDMDYWNERMKNEKGEWMSRGELTINFLQTWKAAKHSGAPTSSRR